MNPKGSKLLYLPPDIVAKFPDLTSEVLQTVLYNMDEWTKYLKLSVGWTKYINNSSQTKVKEALQKMRVI